MATHEPPPALLRAQIDSIRSQTHRDWVCVISDDASSDAAKAEIERAIAGDARFSVESHEERVGFYRNFERALRAVPSEASYVALCDQDDRWHPDKLAALLSALGPDDVLAHSDARVVDSDGRVVAETFWPRGAPRDDRLGDLLFANAVTGASALFRQRRAALRPSVPGLPGRPFHDRWIALVSCGLGGIAYVERPLFDYVQHPAAAHGHARATGQSDRRADALRDRAADLRRRGFHPDWRAAHDEYLARSVSEAIALRLRLSDRLGAADRRRLRMIETLPHSPAAQARLAARWLARAPRGRPGIEGALVRGVLWRRLVSPRNALARRRQTRSRAHGGSTGRTPRRSDARPRYGITVTQGGEEAGFGDYFTARELGDALEATGADVVYLRLDGRGWRRDARALDVIVSLLDRFPLREAPPDALAVAWVRNWSERWLMREWFDEYDHVFATSEASCRLIRERSSARPQLMPLATNPARFHPVAAAPEEAIDVGRNRLSHADLPHLDRDAAPFGAPPQGDHIAAVAVDIHLARRRASRSSACMHVASSLLPEVIDRAPVGQDLTQAEQRGVGQQDVPRRAVRGGCRRTRRDPLARSAGKGHDALGRQPRVLEPVRHVRAADAGREERSRARGRASRSRRPRARRRRVRPRRGR